MKVGHNHKDFMVDIVSYDFHKTMMSSLQNLVEHVWPAVYLIEDGSIKKAYIGESTYIYSRIQNHIQNAEKLTLTSLHVIHSKSFNKSATLDIESRLIKYIAADGIYELQNGNAGLAGHHYYQKDTYDGVFENIWKQLLDKKIAKKSITEIDNSDLFKFSPYKSLTNDQYQSVLKILSWINSNGNEPLFVIGGAGTGKTVLGIYMTKLLKNDLSAFEMDNLDDTYRDILFTIKEIYLKHPSLSIGFVVPQTSLRTTLQRVFAKVKGLSADMVIGAFDVMKRDYDLVFVDEAHRLRRRKNLSSAQQYVNFTEISEKLGLNPNTCDELDWIMKRTKKQVLFYDPTQSIKPTDIPAERFKKLIGKNNWINLSSQLRVLGGNDYIQYVEDILNMKRPKPINKFGDYEFKFVGSFRELASLIKNLNKTHGLCRLIAGFSWEWITNKKGKSQLYDIEIEGKKMRWNMQPIDWINSETSIDEVGCIHTTQGYDLNYSGVIFGREIDYNPITKKIEINKELYFDQNGKKTIKDDEELKAYIINIYKTIMFRGIKGTYVYVINKNLREYLKLYIDSI